MQLIGINRFPHIIAINWKYFSKKAQDLSKYLLLASFYVTKWLLFPFVLQIDLITSSFSKILGWSIIIQLHAKQSNAKQLWVTSWLTLQYLQTLARKNLCVPATSTQAGWDGCWKKKALSVMRICQHAIILEEQSWA